MSCPCSAPDPWQPIPPCVCSVEDRLSRAMTLLGDLTRAAGDSPAQQSDRDFNRAYGAARDFLEANGVAS